MRAKMILLNAFIHATAVTASAAPPPTVELANLGDVQDIESAKCDQDKEKVAAFFLGQIRSAAGAGYQPADQFEKSLGAEAAQTVDAKARAQAAKVAGALAAAIANPNQAADAASEFLSRKGEGTEGDKLRRTNFRMDVMCKGGSKAIPYSDNDKQMNNVLKVCPASILAANPGGISKVNFEVSQVHQTKKPGKDVLVAFSKATLMSPTVKKCDLEAAECRATGAPYANFKEDFKLEVNKDYLLQDTTVVKDGMAPMVNRNLVRVHPIRVCGARAFAVTAFGNGGMRGFDRSSMLGLVVRIGGKTLVIGDLSAQSESNSLSPIPLPTDPWPLWFPFSHADTAATVFSDKVGKVIEIEEAQAVVNGRVGGSVQQASSPAGKASANASAN